MLFWCICGVLGCCIFMFGVVCYLLIELAWLWVLCLMFTCSG